MTDTRVRTAALFALLLGAAAVPAGEPPAKGAGDGAKLVGEWQAVSGEWAGQPMTAKECEAFRIVIDERHVSYVYVGREQSFRPAYSLDPKADPKAIDLTTKDPRRQFSYKAIYALD